MGSPGSGGASPYLSRRGRSGHPTANERTRPLVAGLFVIVEALKDAGTLQIAQTALEAVSRRPLFRGDLTGAFGVALISNLMNNLPVGLIGANALEVAHICGPMKNAFLIGVDLGPNLSAKDRWQAYYG